MSTLILPASLLMFCRLVPFLLVSALTRVGALHIPRAGDSAFELDATGWMQLLGNRADGGEKPLPKKLMRSALPAHSAETGGAIMVTELGDIQIHAHSALARREGPRAGRDGSVGRDWSPLDADAMPFDALVVAAGSAGRDAVGAAGPDGDDGDNLRETPLVQTLHNGTQVSVEAYSGATAPLLDDDLMVLDGADFANGTDHTVAELEDLLAQAGKPTSHKTMSWAEWRLGCGLVVLILVAVVVLVASPPKSQADDVNMSLRIPTRALGIAVLVSLQVCYSLTSYYAFIEGGAAVRVGDSPRHTYAPKALVCAQLLWNAIQVAQLCTLICFRNSCRNWLLCVTFAVTIVMLPLSVYVASPGAHVFAAITFVSALVAVRSGTDVEMQILDETPHQDPPGETPNSPESSPGPTGPQSTVSASQHLCKLEFLAFLCNLGSSIYNMHAEQNLWPYWYANCEKVCLSLGCNVKPGILVKRMYSLGLQMDVPAYIPLSAGQPQHIVFNVVFLVMWSILPFLYTAYFASLFVISGNFSRPSMIVQRVLCLFGMVHFLFITDGVDYMYGRGMLNLESEAYHWSERWAWRVAILVPIYQKVATGHCKKGHTVTFIGVGMHYLVAVLGLSFLLGQVLLGDVRNFSNWVFGEKFRYSARIRSLEHALFLIQDTGYYRMLVVMVFIYGFSALQMRGYRITFTRKE